MSYKIIGHRGNKAKYTENTLAGFRSALETDGIDGFEFDVVVSKDKKLIISHDYFIKDVNNAKHMIYDLSYDEILEIAKNTPDEEKNGIKYPLLEEVLFLYDLSTRTKILLIEIKSLPSIHSLPLSTEEMIHQIHALLKSYQLEDLVYIISFDYRFIEESFKQMPSIKTGLILHRNVIPLTNIIDTLHPSILVMEQNWIIKEQVNEMKKKGINIYAWTPNTQKAWSDLIQIGIAGLITDKPESLLFFKHTKDSYKRIFMSKITKLLKHPIRFFADVEKTKQCQSSISKKDPGKTK